MRIINLAQATKQQDLKGSDSEGERGADEGLASLGGLEAPLAVHDTSRERETRRRRSLAKELPRTDFLSPNRLWLVSTTVRATKSKHG